jgi:hypothetical protein
MKKSEWTDRQLEELLRQMPKIKDHRHPRDIYQNLSIKTKRNNRITWIFPGMALAAALLLFLILAPDLTNLFNGPEHSKEIQSTSADHTNNAKIESNKQEFSLKKSQNQDAQSMSLKSDIVSKTALYQEDVQSGKVLTYWIPDNQGQLLVPVSTIIQHPGNKHWLQLFNENMVNLKEKEWGLSDYYPLDAHIKMNKQENSLVVDVPENHPYGQGSTNEINFVNAIQKNVSTNGFEKRIQFTTNGKPGIKFGNFGEKTEIDIPLLKNRAFFLYVPDGKDVPFLVPSQDSYKDLEAALNAMQMDQSEQGLKAPLSPSFSLSIKTIKNGTLILSVQQNSILENVPNTIYSFEAILLTAKDFGLKKVMLENANLQQLGPFDLTKINSVPVAPNYRMIQEAASKSH